MFEFSLAKLFIVAVFVLILVALGSAFMSLFRGRDAEGTATVKALTVRVALSVGLLVVIVVMSALGLISPNG